MSKLILLSRGLFATVDAADFDWLSQWKWSALKVGRKNAPPKFYAVRMTKRGEQEGKSRMLLMHRVIAEAEEGQVVDHEDNDGLNNRRRNLRACTQSQNSLNHGGHRDRVSAYKGVSPQNGKWAVSFRGRYVGIFDDEIAAARAYDRAAHAADPDFATLNFPEMEDA